ncbi:Uncharacterised protein [Propionibacterium australiense]|nr:Uncharacterised protein [Propionibacterium australiense]
MARVMTWWRTGLAGAGLCSVLVVAGCGSGDAPGPGGSSVGSSSGPVSASPSSGSPVSSAVSPGEEELYAEAERVYRAYFELEQDTFAAGGAESLPEGMDQYVTGRFAELIVEAFAQVFDKGWRMQPGTRARIVYVNRTPEIAREDSVATLSTCVDSSQSPIVDAEDNIIGGGYNTYRFFFRYDDDGLLKIYGSNAERADSCEG